MNPAEFPEANTKFGAPPGMTDSQVRTVPAYLAELGGGNLDGAKLVVVAWKPTEEELKQLANGSLVYLSCLGGLPPHFLTTSFKKATYQE